MKDKLRNEWKINWINWDTLLLNIRNVKIYTNTTVELLNQEINTYLLLLYLKDIWTFILSIHCLEPLNQDQNTYLLPLFLTETFYSINTLPRTAMENNVKFVDW